MNQGTPTCTECGGPLNAISGEPPYCPRCLSVAIAPADPAWDVGGTFPRPAAAAKRSFDESDEDDDRPYVVTGEPEQKPCLSCRKPLPLDAILCNHCGFHQDTGETLQRVYKKIDKEWETGLSFSMRLRIFLAVVGAAAVASIIVAFRDGGFVALFLSWVVGTALCAFIVGTYPRLNVTRGTAGDVRIAKTWRFCFVPQATTEVHWRRYVGIVVTRSGQTDFWDWITLFFLAPWGVIPALVWWYYFVRPDQLDVAFTLEHGYAAMLLYRGRNEAIANDIAATVRAATRLSLAA